MREKVTSASHSIDMVDLANTILHEPVFNSLRKRQREPEDIREAQSSRVRVCTKPSDGEGEELGEALPTEATLPDPMAEDCDEKGRSPEIVAADACSSQSPTGATYRGRT